MVGRVEDAAGAAGALFEEDEEEVVVDGAPAAGVAGARLERRGRGVAAKEG